MDENVVSRLSFKEAKGGERKGKEVRERGQTHSKILRSFLRHKRITNNKQLPSKHTRRRWTLELNLIRSVIPIRFGIGVRNVRNAHRWDDDSVLLLVSKDKPPCRLAALHNAQT